jgi:phosphomannomutase/phosphoglucomutase
MVDHIFREYDIRGIVHTELSVDQVYDLTRAIAVFFKQTHPNLTTIALGMDGRIHSLAIKNEMTRALLDSGINVLFLGTCPTPVLYFSQHTMAVEAGLMITASHNPAEYNGIKLCLNQESVWGVQLQKIKELFQQRAFLTPTHPGTYAECDGVGQYVDYLVQHFPHLHGMTLGVVIDCANAVGGLVMPLLAHRLQWKNVRFLYEDLDGTYPNHEADPVVEKNMTAVKKLLQDDPAMELGIGLDGDCDRMAPMTKAGYLVPGDQLLAVFSKKIVEQYPGAAIVFDVKASATLIDLLTAWGARPCMSACGHSIIKNEMKKQNAVLGGELSCHFCFKDRYFGYDDGIYAALRLFELVTTTHENLDELVAQIPKKISSPEIRFACAEKDKQSIVRSVEKFFSAQKEKHVLKIDGVRVTTNYGWGLLRASNTQAVLSARFEADTAENLSRIKQDFMNAMQPFFDRTFLEKQFQE